MKITLENNTELIFASLFLHSLKYRAESSLFKDKYGVKRKTIIHDSFQ